MIGYIEGFRHSALSALEILHQPDSLTKKPHSSLKTELVLQVASRMALPNSKDFPAEKFRLISNLIYSANNYWDIGLLARDQVFKNKSHQFVASTTVLGETSRDMKKSLKEVEEQYPNMGKLANTFISDGETLFESRKDLSNIQYREIDSGISAVFVFASIGGEECLQNIGIDTSCECQSSQDLLEKYKLFLVNQIDTKKLDNKSKLIAGLQAVEMVICCLDDQWGTSEDTLLKIPGTMQDGLETNKRLLNNYKKKAIECGISPRILELLSLFSYTHLFNTKRIKKLDVLELNDIQKGQCNARQRYYLREWLNSNSVLEELFR